VAWTNLANVTATGNSIQKTGGAPATWDAAAVSNRAIQSGDGYVQATVDALNTYRMFGLNNPTQFEILTEIFRGLGYRNALLVRGFEGLDEASISSPSRVRGFRGEEEFDFVLLPEEVGLKRVAQDEVTPVSAESNYRDFLRIAHGQETGPKRDLIALNAGLALWISERAPSVAEGVQMALERLASGMAAERLTELVGQHGSPDVLRQARERYLDS